MNKGTSKFRVLSGIRASHSSLHLGNLLGAIRGMIELQDDPKYETFYMVADLHGITTNFDPESLKVNRINVAKDFLAAGIDPKKSVLFLQSDVPEHVELAYLISSASNVSDLMRMPSKKNIYKKYSDPGQLEGVSFALLGYPVLMAADILAYKASKVPIGLDQEPHLEFAREVARRMNNKYNLDLPEPTRYSVVAEDFTVPSILGEGKMSKDKPGSAIFLNDSPDVIKQKIFKIPTETNGKGISIPRLGDKLYPLFSMIELLLGKDRRKQTEDEYVTKGVKFSEIKEELSQAAIKLLEPIKERRKYLDENPQEVEKILKQGAIKARTVALKTVNEIKTAMGLL